MTAKIVDFEKWREDHPPLVRLARIQCHLVGAAIRLQHNAWRVWFSMFVVR